MSSDLLLFIEGLTAKKIITTKIVSSRQHMGEDLGEDAITAEVLTGDIQWAAPYVTYLLQQCHIKKKAPKGWRKGTVSFLFKKGDGRQFKNYRAITLLHIIYKIWGKIYAVGLSHVLNLFTCE